MWIKMCMLQIRYPQARTTFLLLFPSQTIPISRAHTASHIPISRAHTASHTRKFNRKSNFSPISKDDKNNHSLTFNYDAIIDYGPSLAKGKKLYEDIENYDSNNYLDKRAFARVFEVAALRVSAEECHGLHNRIKGHLLNWPRIRNIARVPGDDIEPDFGELFTAKEEEQRKISLQGVTKDNDEIKADPVLVERARMVEKFNSRGYIYFRKLAHISRPKKKKKEEGQSLDDRRTRVRRNKDEFAVVEVVEEGVDGDDEDLSGLLGEDYKIKRWRGPTRLLLLDERHAKKSISELPQAVQVVLRGDDDRSRKIKPELLRCKLTLFYDYWQMHEVLEELLPKGMVVPTAFESVGHIAHLNLRTEHLQYQRLIAQVVFDKNRPKIQTVVNKIDAIQNDYRTMQLKVLAGNHSLVTSVVENGLYFHVDLATVYWSSRLATERQRLIDTFRRNDNVCDVFSGVGPLSIAAAKKVNKVYANDLNPSAVKYQKKNIACNKVYGKVELFNLDGREFIKKILGREKPAYITQVVMNLPKDAAEYLDAFRGAFRSEHRNMHLPLPTIHVYGFSKAPSPETDFLKRIESALGETPRDVDMHRVRLVAPGKWMLCARFFLPRSIAFTN